VLKQLVMPEPISSSLEDERQQTRLHEQAAMLLASDALGRSHILEQLFRYLFACTLEGRSPKELEIADQVFARDIGNNDQDASIRVYVHRLRRKLDEFYAGPAASEAVRLTIPKGGYRLAVEEMPDAQPPAPTASIFLFARNRLWLWIAGVLALVAVTASISWWLATRPDAATAERLDMQANPLWQPFASGARRTIIVVGDYYIFGERSDDGDVKRLVREFSVNSPKDLDGLVVLQPEHAGSYVDLGLSYLPVGVGNALRVVVPVLPHPDRNLVLPDSQLTPEMMKNSNIIYLGYLSGLGILRDPVFKGSRFMIGDSYDEIIDRKTGQTFMAGTHLDQDQGTLSQDYALITSFPGVSGNRIVIIAGTRDAALMEAAEYATDPKGLAEMTRTLDKTTAMEALVAVESLNGMGLRARLVSTSLRSSSMPWSGQSPQVFPDVFANAPRADEHK